MDPRKLHSEFGLDERLGDACAYCGGPANSADHVPSKVLLEEPLPLNLPVVPACATCNRSFSSDEEYVACFLECVIVGAVDSDRIRPKIKAALQHSPKLAATIALSLQADPEGRQGVDARSSSRYKSNSYSLRGHAVYSERTTARRAPCRHLYPIDRYDSERSLPASSAQVLENREVGPRSAVGPFCGKRASSIRKIQDGPWIVVQPNRYRYSVDEGLVRLVLAEYLACIVEWN